MLYLIYTTIQLWCILLDLEGSQILMQTARMLCFVNKLYGYVTLCHIMLCPFVRALLCSICKIVCFFLLLNKNINM